MSLYWGMHDKISSLLSRRLEWFWHAENTYRIYISSTLEYSNAFHKDIFQINFGIWSLYEHLTVNYLSLWAHETRSWKPVLALCQTNDSSIVHILTKFNYLRFVIFMCYKKTLFILLQKCTVCFDCTYVQWWVYLAKSNENNFTDKHIECLLFKYKYVISMDRKIVGNVNQCSLGIEHLARTVYFCNH